MKNERWKNILSVAFYQAFSDQANCEFEREDQNCLNCPEHGKCEKREVTRKIHDICMREKVFEKSDFNKNEDKKETEKK